jgi:pantothenate synthetase
MLLIASKFIMQKILKSFWSFIESDFQEYESDNPVTHSAAVQTIYIDELIILVRNNLALFARKKVQLLLVIKDHAQDVIQYIIRYSITNER